MKKSFFERSYLLTLLLFLLLLDGGIFGLSLYTYRTNEEAAKQVCIAEQMCITEAFEADVQNRGNLGDELLLLSYGSFYMQKNISLCFEKNGEIAYTNIPAEYKLPESNLLSINKYDGRRILMIRSELCDGKYTMTYAKDISYLNDDLMRILVVFVIISTVLSGIMAVLLYFVQRKLLFPLRKLQEVTNDIASGNLLSRADESGEDEFSMLAKDFNSMADKISEQMDELRLTACRKQEMLDNLAHEMRTPLTSIHGYAELAFGTELTEEERMTALSAVMSETMRLKSISNALLDMAFMRGNGIERKYFSVAPMLTRAANRISAMFPDRTAEIDISEGSIFINGDETLLEQLVSNLCENAAKACVSGGKIIIGAKSIGSEKQIFVEDNGIGMTPEQLKHITEPFYRTDKSRNRAIGGTGLGLALCKRIAEAHGALLCFESEPGKGTVARVIFPADEEKSE